MKNASKQNVSGQLKGKIGDVEFSQDVQLTAGEQKDLVFDPAHFAQLNFDRPRLWWPAQMGSPELYKLDLRFEVNGHTSDAAETSFGIREVTSELNSAGKRVFSVNGKKFLIRGGGWSPDMTVPAVAEYTED